MSNIFRVRLVVTGRVQGVFFRQSTKRMALELGLVGFVRNEWDGSVSAEVVGPKPALEKLIAWCHKGPPSACVDKVDVEWVDPPAAGEFSTFEVR
jgi:acylphosphatase